MLACKGGNLCRENRDCCNRVGHNRGDLYCWYLHQPLTLQHPPEDQPGGGEQLCVWGGHGGGQDNTRHDLCCCRQYWYLSGRLLVAITITTMMLFTMYRVIVGDPWWADHHQAPPTAWWVSPPGVMGVLCLAHMVCMPGSLSTWTGWPGRWGSQGLLNCSTASSSLWWWISFSLFNI